MTTQNDGNQATRIQQVTDTLMHLFDAQIKDLDVVVQDHWRQRLEAQIEADDLAIEKMNVEERHEQEIAGYKALIQELEKKVDGLREKLRLAEEGIRERDEKLRAISSTAAGIGATSK